jgi:hypothetical protein
LGIIYPLIVHDEHPDIQAYDKLVGISDIVMGEQKEPDDPDAEERRKRQLAHVKREEEAELGDGREPNPGIRQHTKGMQGKETEAHRAKKQRMAR